MLTAARYIKGYERLEPDVLKDASPVLRRGRASNRSFLLLKDASPVLRRGRASNRSFLFGNLHARFCEGAHSNRGAITLERGALWALLDILE